MKIINRVLECIWDRIVEEGILEADDQCDLMYMLYLDMVDAFGKRVVNPTELRLRHDLYRCDAHRRDVNPMELSAIIWQAVQIGINADLFEMVQIGGYGTDVLLCIPDRALKAYPTFSDVNPARFKHLSTKQHRDFISTY